MMASKKSQQQSEVPDAVDQAGAAVDRAIVKLIGLTVSEEPSVGEKAYRALHQLGAAAVIRPMLTTLMGNFSETLKTVTLMTLETFGPEYDQEIALGLNLALPRQRDLSVAARMRMLAGKKGARALGSMRRPGSGWDGETKA